MTPPRPITLLRLLALAAIAGCASEYQGQTADMDDGAGPEDTLDTFVGDTGLDLAGPRLRIVVEPAVEDADEGLILPQTFGPYLDAREFTLVLQPAISLDGTISASVPDPWPGILPQTPVLPRGEIQLVDTTTGRRWETEVADGAFATLVPPGAYTLHALLDEALVPSWYERVDLPVDTTLALDAPEGVPVWGRVLDGLGLPAGGVDVALRTAIGEVGARGVTDAEGWYELRAVTDAATLEVQPPVGRRLPTLARPVLVDFDGGANIDLAWANTGTIAVSARLTTLGDAPIPGLPLRLSSDVLSGYDAGAATWSVDLATDSNGFVDARVPPGTYTLSTRPDVDTPFTARTLVDLDLDGDVDLGDVRIPGLLDTAIRIRGTDGGLLVDAVVSCREVDGRQRTFIGRTGPDGAADMTLPDGIVDCLVTPPPSAASRLAPTRVLEDAIDLVTIELPPGETLSGSIVVEQADGARRPESFAVVRVLDEEDQLLAQTVTGNDGTFVVRVDVPGAE